MRKRILDRFKVGYRMKFLTHRNLLVMFINTLPIIFAFTHLLNEMEMGIFLFSIFLLVYYNTPDVLNNWKQPKTSNIYFLLRAMWQGETTLKQAFWPFFMFANAVLFYADYRVMNVTYTIASWKTVHLMLLLPVIWWTTSVWRCSTHCSHRLYSGAARTVTLYMFVEYFLRFIISTKFPNTFFDCRLLTIEFGDCL